MKKIREGFYNVKNSINQNKEHGVSVIIPVYNSKHTLERCVLSVTKQSFKNIEIILVDDGSTDESPVICKQFTVTDNRIKYYRQENAGPGAARNNGLRLSFYDYVTFTDSDDWIEPDYIEKLITSLVMEKADISVCDINFVDFAKLGKCRTKIRLTASCTHPVNNPDVVNKSRTFCWGKLYRKNLFIDNGMYFPKFIYEDIPVVTTVIALANKVTYVSEPLYNYVRGNPESLTYDNRYISDMYDSLKLTKENFNKFGLFDIFGTEYKKICIAQLRFIVRRFWSENNTETNKEILALGKKIEELCPKIAGLTEKKYLRPANVMIAKALDTALPFPNQIVDRDSMIAEEMIDEETAVYTLAEVIMEIL